MRYDEYYFDTLPEEVKIRLRYIVKQAFEELDRNAVQEIANSVEESRYYTIEELGYKINAMVSTERWSMNRRKDIIISEYKREIFKLLMEYREILKTNPNRFDENKELKKEVKKFSKIDEKEKLNLTDGLHGEELKRKWKNW